MNKFILLLIFATSVSFATKIGVLKADKNFKCNKEITIDLDVEDTHNKTKVVNGDENPPVTIKKGHIIFNYCILDVDEMPKVPYSYAVLRLDEECPSGTFKFARYHDTEDTDNANSPKNSSDVWPSVINKNATLEYCFVYADDNSINSYPIFDKKNGHKYGVFANPKFEKTTISPFIAHSEIFIDDENDPVKTGTICEDVIVTDYDYTSDPSDPKWIERIERRCHDTDTGHNGNYWNYYTTITPPAWSTAWINSIIEKANKVSHVARLMEGDENTTIHVIKWTGTANAMLSKSSVEESNNMPLVVASPLTPDIKEINRSVVAVELKSTGNVKISIVNINGTQIAKIAQENLQPGIHQIKWNSGIVPNGRYIVKIEQNGFVNAKNVILK